MVHTCADSLSSRQGNRFSGREAAYISSRVLRTSVACHVTSHQTTSLDDLGARAVAFGVSSTPVVGFGLPQPVRPCRHVAIHWLSIIPSSVVRTLLSRISGVASPSDESSLCDVQRIVARSVVVLSAASQSQECRLLRYNSIPTALAYQFHIDGDWSRPQLESVSSQQDLCSHECLRSPYVHAFVVHMKNQVVATSGTRRACALCASIRDRIRRCLLWYHLKVKTWLAYGYVHPIQSMHVVAQR